VKPPKSILDRSFRWTSPACTDVAATFRRIRKAMAEEQQQQAANDEEQRRKVKPIAKAKP
jgi:Sec-independent protein translocase protein TatA